MKVVVNSKIRLLLVCLVVVSHSGCSSESTQPGSARISALALKASPAAYAMFQAELDDVKVDNDFTKRAKDPKNYEVSISETPAAYVFTFTMRPLKGERILDGRSVYEVNKDNGKATIRSVL